MTNYFWITDDNLGTYVSTEPDFDPGPGWHSATEAEYDTLLTSFPNPTHTAVHAFLTGAGITDTGAVNALHELLGVSH